MNGEKWELLNELTGRSARCDSKEEFWEIFENLKGLIPFEDYAVLRLHTSRGRLLYLDQLRWFSRNSDFESAYFSEKLQEMDPIFTEASMDILEKDPRIHFHWHRPRETAISSQFDKTMKLFQMLKKRYACFFRFHSLVQFVFIAFGDQLSESSGYDYILERMIPALAHASQFINLGSIESLTDKQKEVLLLSETGMAASDIRYHLHISPTALRGRMEHLKKKIGVTNRFQLGFPENYKLLDEKRRPGERELKIRSLIEKRKKEQMS